MSARRAIVSYAVDASDQERRRVLPDGIRACATELVEMGQIGDAVAELEQVANDAEGGDFDA